MSTPTLFCLEFIQEIKMFNSGRFVINNVLHLRIDKTFFTKGNVPLPKSRCASVLNKIVKHLGATSTSKELIKIKR